MIVCDIKFNRIGLYGWSTCNDPNYDNRVFVKLEEIEDRLLDVHGALDIDPNIVNTKVREFQEFLRNKITSNPDTKINDLIIDYEL